MESSRVTECRANDSHLSPNFICGVVEGFYGRPWTTEQRKDLFSKLKKWGMNSYVYAPKDDYKHRAYWRELYTVEEAEHLISLINAAKENNITFYYAISPGLDITYSNQKENVTLRRKLEQVSQFGCTAFALLFDDIESEMSENDKEVFQSFAHAQVSITNEMFEHLNRPRFLLCPTQYCSTRAVPNVLNSEYLNTLGSQLHPDIDIMWTGSKVISKLITVDCIQEIASVLKRPPIIWDNLHANDYDQKRIFLGPYSGRSPDLIPRLRGVLTNPNCEYGANFIAIHTLSQWSNCTTDWKTESNLNDCISADIKLEIENEDGDYLPTILPPNTYHPRLALKNAVNDWLLEFSNYKSVWGPIAKPQPSLTNAIPVPIIPSINTCMSIMSQSTNTVTNTAMIVNQNELKALAEVCSTVNATESLMSPGPIPVMNSLVSDKEVICSQNIPNPITPVPVPLSITTATKPVTILKAQINPVKSLTFDQSKNDHDTVMECNFKSIIDKKNDNLEEVVNGMQVDGVNFNCHKNDRMKKLTCDDLLLLCDLFYLPFEHGRQGLLILQEFHWLKSNAHVINRHRNVCRTNPPPPEVDEWHLRAKKLNEMCDMIGELSDHLSNSNNRELVYELYPYVWEIRSVVSLLNSYVKWLGFSKGWKESFMSGEQEPWVFRGGLTSDLQRLLPVDSAHDLFQLSPPDVPTNTVYTIRPFLSTDESSLTTICSQHYINSDQEHFAEYNGLISDRFIGSFLTFAPEFCMVVENESDEIIGFICACLDSKKFQIKQEVAWIPEMRLKYPIPDHIDTLPAVIQDSLKYFHNFKVEEETPNCVNHYPSQVYGKLSTSASDVSISKRLIACLLAALRANGSFGAHVVLKKSHCNDQNFYSKLGFTEIQTSDDGSDKIIMGADLSKLCEESKDLVEGGADFLHLDVMDGHFVPNITFGHPVIKCLRKNIPRVPFEAHMMVSDPLKWVQSTADAGVNIYTFHIEAVADVLEAVRQVSETGMKVGIALKPNTIKDNDFFNSLIDNVDRILIMTVEPGFGGQSFIAECLKKADQIRQLSSNINIEVDGGVNFETIASCARSGVNLFVAGTAITNLSDRKQAITKMRTIAVDNFLI